VEVLLLAVEEALPEEPADELLESLEVLALLSVELLLLELPELLEPADELVVPDEVSTEAAAPPWLRPACGPQTGQAPGPCEARTFSATAICWPSVAWSAEEAYAVPP
jgi:hypothetical protein